MGLSSWPEEWENDCEPSEIACIVFDDPMLVKAETDKAIGLSYDTICSDEITLWIPKSQIDGDVPKKDEWIDSICIPLWLAEEKGLV